MTELYTAPFADPDGDEALYVRRTGASMRVADDPRVAALLAAGFTAPDLPSEPPWRAAPPKARRSET